MPKARRKTARKSPTTSRTKRWNWTPRRLETHTPDQPRAADSDALVDRLNAQQPEQPRSRK